MTATLKTAPIAEDPETALAEWVGRVADLEARHAVAVVAAEDAGTLVRQARRASVMGLRSDVHAAIEAERIARADADELAAQLDIARGERNAANIAAGQVALARQAAHLQSEAARLNEAATASDEAIDAAVAVLLARYDERWELVQEATALVSTAQAARVPLGALDVQLRVARIAHLDPNKYPRQSPYELGL
jgi:hypothetical protein